MPDISFPAKIRVSERTGKKGTTKYYRLRVPPIVSEILSLQNNDNVQVPLTKFRHGRK